MKFGVRECANIVFRAKQPIRIGTVTFQAGEPVLYIDTATTSSLEQSTTTVYAQGGRGNARLLAWEGEKTLTFSFTDALLSPIGFAILSGAGLFKRGDGINSNKETGNNLDLVHFHMTSGATLRIGTASSATNTASIDLRDAIEEFGSQASISLDDAPVYIMEMEDDGSLTGNVFTGTFTGAASTQGTGIIQITDVKDASGNLLQNDASVMVDYYIDLPGKHVYEADITPDTFGGNYYVEADTLFRDQYTGKDMPANLTFPNVRLQSNFTMTFAGTGDPSTFDFTMDAFPGYTYFDRKKKVLAVMQIVDTIGLGGSGTAADADPVMYHDDVDQDTTVMVNDSSITTEERGSEVYTFTFTNDDDELTKTLYNIGDSIDFMDFVTVLGESGEDIKDTVRPEFKILDNTNSGGYIELDYLDGHITAKKNTTNPVQISATLYTSHTGNSATSKSIIFKISVLDTSVADG